jgi:hypothetical protein
LQKKGGREVRADGEDTTEGRGGRKSIGGEEDDAADDDDAM